MKKVKIRMKSLSASPDGILHADRVYIVDIKKAKELVEAGAAEYVEKLIETAIQPQPENAAIQYPRHTGGGWYVLSNGEKVQGKDEAIKAQKELEG